MLPAMLPVMMPLPLTAQVLHVLQRDSNTVVGQDGMRAQLRWLRAVLLLRVVPATHAPLLPARHSLKHASRGCAASVMRHAGLVDRLQAVWSHK